LKGSQCDAKNVGRILALANLGATLTKYESMNSVKRGKASIHLSAEVPLVITVVQ
jgi:hypothetical protein